MDPVTTAIVAALSVIAGGAGQAVGGNVATDAYENLKAALKRRFGNDSEVVKSVENLETRIDSLGRKQTLEEDVTASGADQDPEVRSAAQELLDQLRAQPGGEQHIQNAVASYIAQADRSSTAEVRVNRQEEYVLCPSNRTLFNLQAATTQPKPVAVARRASISPITIIVTSRPSPLSPHA